MLTAAKICYAKDNMEGWKDHKTKPRQNIAIAVMGDISYGYSGILKTSVKAGMISFDASLYC